eukprot:521328_1
MPADRADPHFIKTIEIQQGLQMFQIKCQRCHSNSEDGRGQQRGPNLFGIVGRIAGYGKYKKYSHELKTSGLVWNRKNLKKYMYDPQRLVPGTGMFYGAFLPSDMQGDCIVTYLESISPGYEERLKVQKKQKKQVKIDALTLPGHPEVPLFGGSD